MQLEVCLVEDHAALQILHMSLSCLAGARVHGVRNGNVRVGEADGVEVDELLLIFAAGLAAIQQFNDVGIDIAVADHAIFIAAADGLCAVLDGLPVVADDLIGLLHDGASILPLQAMNCISGR